MRTFVWFENRKQTENVEMNKIDQLPVEILIKIFSYLPTYKKVSLVNKLFYNVARILSDPKICLRIDGNLMDRQTSMETVENMERNISKLVILFPGSDNSQWQATDFEAVIRKFSANIKYLELRHASINMSKFVQILSLLANVEHLIFIGVRVVHYQSEPISDSDECLILHQLKNLELVNCNEHILAPFNKMPGGVLQKLSLTSMRVQFEIMSGFLTHQHNIKNVILSNFDRFEPLLFDRLELESLYYTDIKNRTSLAIILRRLTKLKDLSINGSDYRIFNIITGELQRLEKLYIAVNYNSGLPFASLSKLKELKHLTIDSCSPEIIEILAGLDNSRLSTLTLEDMDSISGAPMTVHLISRLAKSAPNLKELNLDCSFEVESAVGVIQYFNFLEVLEISIQSDIDIKIMAEKIEIDRCTNPKLRDLKITGLGQCDESLLKKLIQIYPNMKKITLDFGWYYLNEPADPSKFVTNSQLQLMLDGFRNIQFLELYFPDIKLTSDNCDLIVKYNRKFDSITIAKDKDIQLSTERDKQMTTAFDIVRYYEEEEGFHLKLMKIK